MTDRSSKNKTVPYPEAKDLLIFVSVVAKAGGGTVFCSVSLSKNETSEKEHRGNIGGYQKERTGRRKRRWRYKKDREKQGNLRYKRR